MPLRSIRNKYLMLLITSTLQSHKYQKMEDTVQFSQSVHYTKQLQISYYKNKNVMTKKDKTLNNIRAQVHPKCIICSLTNANGLHLKFDAADNGNVKADFQCNEVFEGYPGILHGGIISSILDGIP